MEKQLYIIRHGETDLNKKGIVQGRGVNSPLNETGLKQALAFYEAYRDERFDRIYTSTMLRTHQTVEQFIRKGIPWTQLSGLDEISWGIYEGLEQNEQVMSGFTEITSGWCNGKLDLCVEGGETPLQLVERQKEAVDRIVSAAGESKVLVCMHGRAMRTLLCYLTDRPLYEMDEFPHTNTALYKIRYFSGKFEITDAYNINHLQSLTVADK